MCTLILAPHTDDGELGCGATISKLIEEGVEVYYVAFSICEDSVPKGFPRNILETEAKRATLKLGIKPENLIIKKYPVRRFPEFRQAILDDIIHLRETLKPNLIFMPSSFDIHQDHNTIFLEGRRAFKNQSLLGYEFIWNNITFNTTCHYVVNETHINKKIQALDEYKSQKHRLYSKETMIKSMANFRGLQIEEEYAEAFEIIRWIIK